MVAPDVAGVLLWQHELTWSLVDLHLDGMSDDDLHWRPAPICWSLHPAADGGWVPDWADVEPDPIPVPTIAWVTWHLGWWWSTALAHLDRRPAPSRDEVAWPGDLSGTRQWLASLHEDWVVALSSLPASRLGEEAAFPWPQGSGRTVADMLAWANAELMKNVAELGQLRLLRAAGAAPG